MSGFIKLIGMKYNGPSPSTQSFAGRTVLLTGASSGLGLEAAKKLAALNCDRLIITARGESKGQAAKKDIEQHARLSNGKSSTEIIPMILSMSTFADVKKFASDLATRFPEGIDGAILNAGAMNIKFNQSSDGWEDTLQVNALSTLLLGLLILPLLLKRADAGAAYKPHLTFISSGTAWMLKPEQMKVYMDSEKPLEEFNAQKNFTDGIGGGQKQYASSKLTLEYAFRRLAKSAALKDANGQNKVIINTTCPGLCKSDLGREATKSIFMKFFAWLLYALVAREAEVGANTYITALDQDEKTHGEMWKDDKIEKTGPMVSTERGQQMGEKIWPEVVQVMLKADPSTKPFLN
jgi:NAD(P)-dependent dehydrogenase (short-subunit alcohol dehydrogenase family)